MTDVDVDDVDVHTTVARLRRFRQSHLRYRRSGFGRVFGASPPPMTRHRLYDGDSGMATDMLATGSVDLCYRSSSVPSGLLVFTVVGCGDYSIRWDGPRTGLVCPVHFWLWHRSTV